MQDFSASPSTGTIAPSDPLARLKGKPTNFLCVDQRNGAIKGTYIIDPSLQIPESHLPPPVKEGEGGGDGERKNLYLHTRDGSVDVDVWLVGHKSRSKGSGERTTLHVSSNDGAITTKIVRLPLHPAAGMLTVPYDIFAASHRQHRSILSEHIHKGWQNNRYDPPVFPWPDHNDVREWKLHTLQRYAQN